MGSAPGTAPKSVKKAVARVTLVNLEESILSVLRDAFKQFEIECVALDDDAAKRMHREKFEALAIRLDERAHEVLEATRTSPSNRRIVVFGISEGKPLGLQFSKYGINTLLEQPIDKQKALKAVRSAHLLIIHELRRYVRIPLVVPVRVDLDHGRRLDALTNEISAGGMSLTARDPFPKMSNVQVTFTLPQSKKTTITAALCWRREQENMVGIRFDLADDNRFLVRKWIDDFLDTD